MWSFPLGAVILTILPEVLQDFAEYRDIMCGILLVALMAFRPDGILSYDVIQSVQAASQQSWEGRCSVSMLLEVQHVIKRFGGVTASSDISFSVAEGEFYGIIGSNGAGKSTTMKTIMGIVAPRQGTVSFQGKELKHEKSYQVVREGISLVPEGRQILQNMSVEDNLYLGAYQRSDTAGIAEDLQHIYEKFPRLLERKKQYGGTLSGGEQQMLAIGRAMMARPKLLLLDEPSMGLAPIVVQEIFDVIQDINTGGTTVLLVEQNAKKALQIADYAYVMETGRIVLHGKAADIASNPQVTAAYLGGSTV